ncbi:MAG: hypothetical protein RIT27_2493 [Pseudomonadota bacterium]|jgi:hypothetical protein
MKTTYQKEAIVTGKVISIFKEELAEAFYGFNIDLPFAHTNIIDEQLEIHGWVLGRYLSVKNIMVKAYNIHEEKITLETTKPNLIRTDIGAAFTQIENAEQAGFFVNIKLIDLPNITTLFIMAELEDGQQFILGKIELKHLQKVTGSILSITKFSTNKLYGFNLDLPIENMDIIDDELEIHGWALGSISPVDKIIVKIDEHYQEKMLLDVDVTRLIREDIATAFPDKENAMQSGFFIKLNLHDFASVILLQIIAILENGEQCHLNSILLQHQQKITCRISEIPFNPISPKLYNYRIDLPNIELFPLDHLFYDLEISGWVLGRSAQVIAIEFVDEHDQQLLKSVPINFSRPDVSLMFPTVENAAVSGFSTILNLLLLPTQTIVSISALLSNEERITLTCLNIQRLPFHTLYEPQLKPLIINSLGRSGTTWIMHLLAQHFNIATYQQYPYELPIIEHYIHNVFMRNLLDLQPDQIPYPELDVNDLFKLNRHRMFHVKEELLRTWFRKQQVEELAAFCQTQIDHYIEQLLNYQQRIGDGLKNPVYFAEKLINPSRDTEYLSRLLWELYPQGKEIILVRDFRDMFCSILAFMKKRDLKICFGLDFQYAQTEEDYVNITKERIDFIVDCWETRKHKAYLVRYEDLIEKPLPILKGMFEYLDVEHNEDTLQMIWQKASLRNAEMTDHITSSTVDASLGRWKQDLSPTLQNLCNEAFKSALETFGYTVET